MKIKIQRKIPMKEETWKREKKCKGKRKVDKKCKIAIFDKVTRIIEEPIKIKGKARSK